jgi:hypothetical protein
MSDTAAERLRSDRRVLFVAKDREVRTTELPTGIDRIDADASSTRSGDADGRSTSMSQFSIRNRLGSN